MSHPPEGMPRGPNDVRLDYEPVVRRGIPAALQLTLGAVAAAGTIMPVAVVALINVGIVAMTLATLFVIATLVFVAVRLRRSPSRGAWAAGIWVGIGFAMLAGGSCWLIVTQVGFAG